MSLDQLFESMSQCGVFATDTVVTLDARPAANSIFVGWSGDVGCEDGRVTMTKSRSCGAVFELTASVLQMDGFETDDTSGWTGTTGSMPSSCSISGNR